MDASKEAKPQAGGAAEDKLGLNRKTHSPFIMPDGRPLGLFLMESNLVQPDKSKKGKKRPGAIKAVKEGWTTRGGARVASRAATAASCTDAEQMEMDALARVGQRRRRRWLNDRLLRSMAGPLTAADMDALFKPVPFGDTGHVSLFSQATSPEYVQVWDLFRSVDMDKESRVLKKWEAHVRELQQGPHAIQNAAVDALAAWSGVSWKARKAMKRANPAHVEEIEAHLLGFMDKAEDEAADGGGELVLELEDGFHRLIAHGLAEFHALSSFSRADPDGIKRVVLRHRRSAGVCPPPAITCADILMLLEDSPEHGLNSRVLQDAYCHGHGMDTSSDAGVEQLVPQMMTVAVQ